MAFKIIDANNVSDVPSQVTVPGKKTRILMMTDSPILSTGMGVVLREISLGLHATGAYEVIVAGWGHNGYPTNFPFPILPASSRDFGKNGNPEAGIPGLAQMIDMVKPDVLWALGDSWMLNYIKDLPNRKSFKYIQYMPVDGSPIPDYWIDWFSHADQLVLYSKYGVEELKKTSPNFNPPPEMIYHGNHPERYFPLPKEVRSDIRKKIAYWSVENKQLVTRTGFSDDVFIVGTVARNQPRKNFDKIIKTFALFSKDKPNARLWLHSAVQDAAYNLSQLADMYKIGDKVCFTPNYNLTRGLSEQDMNFLMNIFDVHFLPCQGEGFGLPIIETMAAGVPQVVPDYTAHVEWCKDASELIPIDWNDDMITGMPHPVERAIPKVSESLKCLEKLYANKEHREKLAKNARSIAEKMTWTVTIPQWHKVIQDVVNRKEKSSGAENIIKI